MLMSEKQSDKIIIHATRSVHSDSQENDWVSLILVKLTIMTDLFDDHIPQNPVWLRISSGGHSLCECSICTLSGTPKAVMSHCDVHHQRARREPISSLVTK